MTVELPPLDSNVRACPIAHLLGDYSVLGVEGPGEHKTVDPSRSREAARGRHAGLDRAAQPAIGGNLQSQVGQ
jgi:hypothetical protein